MAFTFYTVDLDLR